MGLDQLLNDTKASKTMGFLHAITKIQIHNYSFGRQASKVYLSSYQFFCQLHQYQTFCQHRQYQEIYRAV